MGAGLIAVAVALSIVGAAPAMAVTPLADSKTGEPGSNETLATPVGRSGVTVYLSNGSYGQTDLYWKPAPCMWPYQTGECGDVYLDVVTKGPDGANLYSFDAPVRVVLACPDAVCAPVTTRRPYDPWIDYRAYRQAVSLKVNGEYPSTSLAPPCQPRSAGRKARGRGRRPYDGLVAGGGIPVQWLHTRGAGDGPPDRGVRICEVRSS